MHHFIQQLPKVELHVHLEGTLEPELAFKLAQRNGIALEYSSPEEILATYDFDDLPSFLKVYHAGMDLLRTEQDFYDLAYSYFEKAAEQNIVYAEPFFDPQAHTSRGISFTAIIRGIHQAQQDALRNLGVESNLIMCFLRDLSADSAYQHLQMAMLYKDWIIGVGLDSDEKDNPPSKFAEVFCRARVEGFKLTMHCDVNQHNTIKHLQECLNLIQVDRIDHGVNSLEDDSLCAAIAARGLGLTVCPVSNRFVAQSLTGDEIRTMLSRGMKATINSDVPAYFRAYLKQNLEVLAGDAGFTKAEIVQLTRNGFEVSWLPEPKKQAYIGRLDAFAAAHLNHSSVA